MNHYTLTASEKQMRIIKEALDLFSRVLTGDFVECRRVCQEYMVPEYHAGACYSEALHNIDECLKEAGMMMTGEKPKGISSPKSPHTAQIAYDLEQVIRNKIAWTNKPEGGHTVDFDDPFVTSKEPLAKIEYIEIPSEEDMR